MNPTNTIIFIPNDDTKTVITNLIIDKITNNTNTVHNKPITRTERKEEKRNTPNPVEFDEIVESADSESDTSLDNIREQIMQTLSSLEQAEVE